MEESAENLSSIKHFAPAAGTGLRGKLLWQYFGGVKDLVGQKAPHGLGVKHFACERTQSHLSRTETGHWMLGALPCEAHGGLQIGSSCQQCCGSRHGKAGTRFEAGCIKASAVLRNMSNELL